MTPTLLLSGMLLGLFNAEEAVETDTAPAEVEEKGHCSSKGTRTEAGNH